MNSTDFLTALIKKLNNNSTYMSADIIKKIHQNYIDYHSAKNPNEIFVIPMEAMAELTQHLSKIIREKENTNNASFLEELVNVQICIDNLRLFCCISDTIFEYAKEVKLERIKKEIEEQQKC